MAVKQILNFTEFARGNESSWQQMTVPIPSGVIVISIDEGKFKMGDGVTLYAALPTLFTWNQFTTAKEGMGQLFGAFDANDDGEIVYIDGGKFVPSGTTLSSVLTNLTNLETNNATQTTNFQALMNKLLKVDKASILAGSTGNLVTITGQKYMDSGASVDDIVTQAGGSITNKPGGHIESIDWFTDSGCTIPISKTKLHDNGTYWVKLDGFHDNTNTPTYTFTCGHAAVTVTLVAGVVYKVVLGDVCLAADIDTPVVFVGSIDDGTTEAEATKSSVAIVNTINILVSVYGGTGADYFRSIAIDSSDNIICAGNTGSEGQGDNDALVVKFDSSLTILARKIYGGIGDESFYNVAIDSSDNIICAGLTISEGQGSSDVLIVKFDSSLTILARKIYGGIGDDVFKDIIMDSNDNIICVGSTTSEGQGSNDALVIKFDSSLTILARKIYGGIGDDRFQKVAIDSNDNIICVGSTTSEGQGSADALVVKFDSSLSILAAKIYGGVGSDIFWGIEIDSNDNIICVGWADSEGQGSHDALVIKFDSSLTSLARKIYGGIGDDIFNVIAIDSSDNIICAGYTTSEGQGGYEALVVKFDSSLTILARKIYGGIGDESFYNVAIDSSDNIICAGLTISEGQGSADALVVKFPNTIPSGSFVGTVLTGLTLADSALVLADSVLTLADSALTLADSTLTLADSTLTLANSTLTQESDVLG